MDAHENAHELIEAYLLDKLDFNQKTAFEQQLGTDASLRADVERHRKAQLALRYGLHQSRKERLKAIDQDLAHAKPPVARRVPLMRRLAVAAGFLILIAAGASFYTYRTYTTNAVAERLFSPAQEETFRGREEYVVTLGQKFAEAERLFQEGKYDQARQLYLVIIKEDSLLKGQAEWNLTLCYYAMDPSSTQFTILFDRLLADTTHDYHTQAVRFKEIMHHPLYKLVHR